MRVLHLTRDLPPDGTGGISSAVGGLVEASARAGIDCAVLSFDSWRPRARATQPAPPRHRIQRGVPVWRLRAPDQLPPALDSVADLGPDLLHLHDGLLWQAVLALQERVGPVPVCLTTHVLHNEMHRLRGLNHTTMSLAGQEAAQAGAGLVIAPSHAAAACLLRDYPQLASRLQVIGLGCEPQLRFSRRQPGPPLVLVAGRFSDVKGSTELLQALPELLGQSADLQVVVAGGNPESPRSERRWLRRLADAVPAGLRGRVLFTGWLNAQALAGLYRRAHLLLLPSWFETFGLAALEAMAHGIPVVGTTGGALPEVIGDTGLLVPTRDHQRLVEATLELLADPRRRRELGAAAIRRARRLFSWAGVIDKHRDAYRQLHGRFEPDMDLFSREP